MPGMVSLEPVVPDNYEAVLKLTVRPDQESFVAPVVQSLADAYVWKGIALAAREGDEVVGFVLLYRERPEDDIKLVRLLVDASRQGEGIGTGVLTAAMEYARAMEPRPKRMQLSVVPENATATRLYEGFGFAGNEIHDGERVMVRDL